MQFNAFKFSTPSSENIKVLPLGRKSNVLKISPEHSPGSSLVFYTVIQDMTPNVVQLEGVMSIEAWHLKASIYSTV